MIDDAAVTDDLAALADATTVGVAPTMQQEGPPENVNLALDLDDEEAEKLASAVCADYDSDVESRSGRMRRRKELYELYAMVTKAKSFPFAGAANVVLPVLAGPCIQVQARLIDMVWPEAGKLLFAVPTNPTDVTRASLAERFANAYIRYHIPEMPQGLDDTMFQLVVFGSAFRRTCWNPYEERISSDWIPMEDFVVSHKYRSSDPSMRDVPRYTLVHRNVTWWDLQRYGEEGVYANTDLITAADAAEGEDDSEFRTAVEKIDGIDSDSGEDSSAEDKPRFILEQHRVWRLPDRPDVHPAFDGKAHAVIVWVDKDTETLLRLVVREEDNPADARRFQRDEARYLAYQQEMDISFQAEEARNEAIMMGLPVGPTPPPPVPVDPPRPQRKRAISFFTHYRAYPSEGFYGIGLAELLLGLAKASNTVLNQHLDRMSLANAAPLLIDKRAKMQRGSISVAPGKVTEIETGGLPIRDIIQPLGISPGDPSTMHVLSMLEKMAGQIGGSADIMSGRAPGSNQTAKGMAILSEQAMMSISVLARRVKEAFSHELDKMWRLWGTFLPDDEVVGIIGEDGIPQEVQIGRDMFTQDIRVIPASDIRLKSQRIEEAMQQFGWAMQNPTIAQNPNSAAFFDALNEQVLRSMGGERYLQLLPKSAQPPQGPPPPAPPYEEHAAWLSGGDHPVTPEDDDDAHINEHMTFLGSPEAAMLDEAMRDRAVQHVRNHYAQRITKQGQANAQQQAAPIVPGFDDGAGVPMDGPAGDPSLPEFPA